MDAATTHTSKIRSWGTLLFVSFLVWCFGWVVGPNIKNNIPIYKEIVQVAEERDINTAAYMYEESVGSYDGEYYLRDSFIHSGRDDYGPTKAFFSGMAVCFVLLAFGWRYMMDP